MEAAKETTSIIRGNGDETSHVELSPLDQFVTTFACIPWATFYTYDISGEKLKTALEHVAVTYPVLTGRLKTKPESRVEVVVSKETGFSFVEATSEMSLMEAVGMARVVEQPAAFPSFAQLPFFIAPMNMVATIDQDAPLLVVKLTHFKDGCCLAVSVHHTLADAQRLAELMVDISVAYRGEELRKVDHDRSQGWPDKLMEKVPVGLKPEDFPRKIATPFDNLPLPSFPEETFAVESYFFPVNELEELKKKISAVVTEVPFVSTMDVVTALLWMLHGELEAVREGKVEVVKTAEDMGLFNSFFLYFFDLVQDGSPLITKNFFGNAYVGVPLTIPEAPSEELKKLGIFETAVFVATVVRKFVFALREPPAQVMACINVYNAVQKLPPVQAILGGISSFFKMPFDKMDYEKGPPVFNYGLPAYPFSDVWGGVCPSGNGKAAVIQKIVRSRDRQSVINSTVLKQLVPGFVMLSEKNPQEIAKLLELDGSA